MSYLILLIGLLINIKIYYWITILNKGFKSETPEMFLRRPNLYAIIDIIFFIVVIIFSRIPWYLVLIFYFLSFIPAGILVEKKINKITKKIKQKKNK